MIGVFKTIHPNGYSISIRYLKIDDKITILGVHSYGKDVLGELSSLELQTLIDSII